MLSHRSYWVMLAVGMLCSGLLAGCSGAASNKAISATDIAAAIETEQASAEPTKLPGTTDFSIPAEDAGIANPITADDPSLTRGQEIYESNCIN